QIQQLISNEKNIKLTKYQIKLLELFISHKNQVLSSETIFYKVWDELSEYNSANIRTLVKKLRQKLPDESIETLYGGGYKLN
ncbi:MAG: helix-turn-helix domain-containing protein, partial [Campylobacterota bacterium]|nr:helix-turn-helix domain-containing protein [Campylobacterota bacterium]